MSSPARVPAQPAGTATSIQPPRFSIESGDECAAEKWRRWRKRWQAYGTVTELGTKGDDYKMACLHSALADDALDLLDNLPYENSGDEKNIDKVLDLLEKHYAGKTNEIYESYKFFQRSQLDGEHVTDYIAAIRAQAGKCNFQALKDRLIRDRIVCGIRDKSLQRSFLEDPTLTLQKCVEKCRAAEQAKKQTAEITAAPTTSASKGVLGEQEVFLTQRPEWDKRRSGNQWQHGGTRGADQPPRQCAAATTAVVFTRPIHDSARQRERYAIIVEILDTFQSFAVLRKGVNARMEDDQYTGQQMTNEKKPRHWNRKYCQWTNLHSGKEAKGRHHERDFLSMSTQEES